MLRILALPRAYHPQAPFSDGCVRLSAGALEQLGAPAGQPVLVATSGHLVKAGPHQKPPKPRKEGTIDPNNDFASNGLNSLTNSRFWLCGAQVFDRGLVVRDPDVLDSTPQALEVAEVDPVTELSPRTASHLLRAAGSSHSSLPARLNLHSPVDSATKGPMPAAAFALPASAALVRSNALEVVLRLVRTPDWTGGNLRLPSNKALARQLLQQFLCRKAYLRVPLSCSLDVPLSFSNSASEDPVYDFPPHPTESMESSEDSSGCFLYEVIRIKTDSSSALPSSRGGFLLAKVTSLTRIRMATPEELTEEALAVEEARQRRHEQPSAEAVFAADRSPRQRQQQIHQEGEPSSPSPPPSSQPSSSQNYRHQALPHLANTRTPESVASLETRVDLRHPGVREVLDLLWLNQPDVRAQFHRLGLKPPAGLLLHGVSGTGKTWSVRRAAELANNISAVAGRDDDTNGNYGSGDDEDGAIALFGATVGDGGGGSGFRVRLLEVDAMDILVGPRKPVPSVDGLSGGLGDGLDVSPESPFRIIFQPDAYSSADSGDGAGQSDGPSEADGTVAVGDAEERLRALFRQASAPRRVDAKPNVNQNDGSILQGNTGSHLRPQQTEQPTPLPTEIVCVLINGVELLCPRRTLGSPAADSRLVATLLTQLDGARPLSGSSSATPSSLAPSAVVVVGTTSEPDALDPALRRPGRLDREVRLTGPPEHARRDILLKLCLRAVEGHQNHGDNDHNSRGQKDGLNNNLGSDGIHNSDRGSNCITSDNRTGGENEPGNNFSRGNDNVQHCDDGRNRGGGLRLEPGLSLSAVARSCVGYLPSDLRLLVSLAVQRAFAETHFSARDMDDDFLLPFEHLRRHNRNDDVRVSSHSAVGCDGEAVEGDESKIDGYHHHQHVHDHQSVVTLGSRHFEAALDELVAGSYRRENMGWLKEETVPASFSSASSSSSSSQFSSSTSSAAAAETSASPSSRQPQPIQSSPEGLAASMLGGDDLGGMEAVQQKLLRAVVWPALFPERFLRLGVTPPRGILLYGPPGCGKTSVVRAMARALARITASAAHSGNNRSTDDTGNHGNSRSGSVAAGIASIRSNGEIGTDGKGAESHSVSAVPEDSEADAGGKGLPRCSFFTLAGGAALYSAQVGESERRIRDLFALARANLPAVIFLDEIDCLAGNRGALGSSSAVHDDDGFDSDHQDDRHGSDEDDEGEPGSASADSSGHPSASNGRGGNGNNAPSSGDGGAGGSSSTSVEARVLSTLLNELDGLQRYRIADSAWGRFRKQGLQQDRSGAAVGDHASDSHSHNSGAGRAQSPLQPAKDAAASAGLELSSRLLLVASTNRPESIDNALVRPGRFDECLYVPPPDCRGRLAILRIHTRRLPLDTDVRLEAIAERSELFTGADLENLCREAVLQRLRRAVREAKEVRQKQRGDVQGANSEFRSLLQEVPEDLVYPVAMSDFEAALRQVGPSLDWETVRRYERMAKHGFFG